MRVLDLDSASAKDRKIQIVNGIQTHIHPMLFEDKNLLACAYQVSDSEWELKTNELDLHTHVKTSRMPLTSAPHAIPELGVVLFGGVGNKTSAFDVETHELKWEIALKENGYSCIASIPHTGLLATAHHKKIDLYSIERQEHLGSFQFPSDYVPDTVSGGEIQFSPDGSLLSYTAPLSHRIYIWSTTDFSHQLTYNAAASGAGILECAFSPDSNFLAVSQGEQVTMHKLIRSVAKPRWPIDGEVVAIAADPPSRSILSLASIPGQRKGKLSISFLDSKDILRRNSTLVEYLPKHSPSLVALKGNRCWATVNFVVSSEPNNRGNYVGNIREYEIPTFTPVHDHKVVQIPECLLAANGGELFVSCRSPTLLYAAKPDDELQSWSAPEDILLKENRRYLTATELGSRIVCTDQKGQVTVVSWKGSPTKTHLISVGSAPIECAAFEADTNMFVTGDDNGSISVVDVDKGKILAQRKDAHLNEITCMTWLNAGILVTGGRDAFLRVWRVSTEDGIDLKFELPLNTAPKQVLRGLTSDSILLLRERCLAVEELSLEELESIAHSFSKIPTEP